jgi:hypothetical protein
MNTLARLTFVVLALIPAAIDAQGRQASPATAKPAPAAIGATEVAVTVTYTGKGVVDAKHNILLFLFDNPNVGPDSRPLGPPQIATRNGMTVTFKDVTTKPVYVFAIYNEKGTYDGQSGPPPAGTPVGMHGSATAATPVTPGMKTPIKMSFSGAKKWGSQPDQHRP